MKALHRRDVLRLGGAGAVAVSLYGCLPRPAPFAHGVASGDPLPTGFVLWTRVTPSAAAVPGSGVGAVVPIDPGTYPVSPSVATELVCTSVTSDNLDEITGNPPRTTSVAVEELFKASNRHVKLLEFDSHGWSVVDADADRLRMDWYYVSDRTDPRASGRFAQAWKVRSGANRVTPTTSALSPRH